MGETEKTSLPTTIKVLQQLKDIQNKINNQIVDIIADAIEKIFLKKIDKEYIRSVYIKYL